MTERRSRAPQVFDAHAAEYDAARRRLIPPFDAFYATAVEAIALGAAPPRRILDLGAGTGLLSRMVRSVYPEAHLTLIDGAGQMLARARTTLGEVNSAFIEADLNDPLPQGRWDAVVSSLAIHHLTDAGKRALIGRVHEALAPHGVFVNAEQVAGPSPRLDRAYAEWHERRARVAGATSSEWSAAVRRMDYDRRATVEDQLDWLRQAGFHEVDCLFKDHRFAVLVALA